METDQPTPTPQNAANAYLLTLAAVADCLGQACPEVGFPYRQRLHRLRSRLAFTSTPEAMQESAAAVAQELEDYASKASQFLYQHGAELRGTVGSLETIVHRLAQRQEFYGARLRQFATQMQTTSYPADAAHLSEVIALQVAGLLSVVESLNHEAHSLVASMQAELEAVEQRLADAAVTDRLTGLMNRREMERQIEGKRAEGVEPVLLRIELCHEVAPEVTRQIAEKLVAQFRHSDRICRWSTAEFLVLFDGSVQIAENRAPQVVAWITGRYELPGGISEEVTASAALLPSNELVASE